MLEIPPTPPLPTVPPAQDFSKLGFVYITVFGLADQVVPHTRSWQSLATAVSYLARIVPIVYLAFQVGLPPPVRVQPDSVAASLPGPKPLAALQDSASKPPVQDAGNFPEVPKPDTSSLPSEIDKFLPESYSELPQSPGEGTEPKEAPNTQINKQKDLKSSHPKAASGSPPVLRATLPSETPNANLPKPRKPNQVVKPGSVV
ncbi:hypothetical protein DSO57_1021525 [Entomophthora muscae]|uniref:Uncharacterized protein n=1 Tax=Entomophthora muscae TaxID=34485 RepID=A0ACC2SG19_9FUNG|nr:hypothetical protein DSO57_1021525 [Entomophthora muscae]